MTTKQEKEDEIDKIYGALFDAIPENVCSINVLIALNTLAAEWAENMPCGCEDEEDRDEDHLMSGTNYSAN